MAFKPGIEPKHCIFSLTRNYELPQRVDLYSFVCEDFVQKATVVLLFRGKVLKDVSLPTGLALHCNW